MDKNKHKDEGFDEMIFKPDLDIRFGNKSSLKRSEETGIPLEDEKAIAIIEGDAEMDKEAFELSVLYAKTKLQPDPVITYPHHASLKKRVAIIPLAARYAAAAAILLLFSLGIWFIFSPDVTPVRQVNDLARLESISTEHISSSQELSDMTYRKAEALQISSPGREIVKIEKINSTSSGHILASPTLASANIVLYSRPSNTQNPEPGTQDIALNEPKKKSLAGKIFSGMFSKAKAPFEGNAPSSESESSEGFLWNLAELGMKGVNAMGDHDYTVVRDYNNKGNVKGLIVLEE
jgi:hypothetical protein